MRGTGVRVAIATLAVGALALTEPIAFGAGPHSTRGAASRPVGIQVRTVAIHGGVNKLSVSVRQTFGVRPPAILFKSIPPRLNCRVLSYGYQAHQASFESLATGKLRMSLKCGRVPSSARVRLEFRAPIERVFALRNGPGSVHVVLDVPRGRTRPLLELGIRPPGKGTCKNLGRSLSVRGNRFDLRISGRCRGLRRGTEGVLSIGGLLLDRSARSSSASSPAARAANAVATVAGFKSLTDKDGARLCQSSEGKVVIQCTQTLEMWWGRTYSQEYSQDCPTAWYYVSNGGYPGWNFRRVPDVGPTSDGDFAGVWTFTMWGIVSPPLKVVLSWRCDLGSPVNTARPAVEGAPIVAKTIRCRPGAWTGDVTGLAYQWLRGGTPVPGATSAEYTPTTTDHASRMTCQVTATNLATASGKAKPAVAASAPTEPVVLGPPVPTGNPYPSMTRLDLFGADSGSVPPTVPSTSSRLRCNTGAWTDAFSFGYQWLRNGLDIPGATGHVYKVQQKDLGASIRCLVRGHNPAGTASASSASSEPVRQGGGNIL